MVWMEKVVGDWQLYFNGLWMLHVVHCPIPVSQCNQFAHQLVKGQADSLGSLWKKTGSGHPGQSIDLQEIGLFALNHKVGPAVTL
jgi:hypothetical protein